MSMFHLSPSRVNFRGVDVSWSLARRGTPQVLLSHHLKQLKLPTVLREYDKVAANVPGTVWITPAPCCD